MASLGVDGPRGGAANQSRDYLMRRLFPSIRYELAQISAALSLETASATRWLTPDRRNIEEFRSAEGRVKKLLSRADTVMRAVTGLDGDEALLEMSADLSAVADLATGFTRHDTYQAASSVRVRSAADLPRVRANPLAILHLLLVLILEYADAGPGLIDVAVRADGNRLLLSVQPERADTDHGSPFRADLLLLVEATGGRLVCLGGTGAGVELAFQVAPFPVAENAASA